MKDSLEIFTLSQKTCSWSSQGLSNKQGKLFESGGVGLD